LLASRCRHSPELSPPYPEPWGDCCFASGKGISRERTAATSPKL
jgi:hypothetical protein